MTLVQTGQGRGAFIGLKQCEQLEPVDGRKVMKSAEKGGECVEIRQAEM